jgi:hypothetical protein
MFLGCSPLPASCEQRLPLVCLASIPRVERKTAYILVLSHSFHWLLLSGGHGSSSCCIHCQELLREGSATEAMVLAKIVLSIFDLADVQPWKKWGRKYNTPVWFALTHAIQRED